MRTGGVYSARSRAASGFLASEVQGSHQPGVIALGLSLAEVACTANIYVDDVFFGALVVRYRISDRPHRHDDGLHAELSSDVRLPVPLSIPSLIRRCMSATAS